MTDREHVDAVAKSLNGAADELIRLSDYSDSEFPERFRRWKERITAYILSHVSEADAERFAKVPTKWDGITLRSFWRMRDAHTGFLRVLGDEVIVRPAETLIGPGPGAGPPPAAVPPTRVFISHAASDKPLALAIRELILQHLPEAKVFVASRAGHITTGEAWFSGITSELRSAEAHVVLLTRDSVNRPWINFETGAAWFSRRPLLTLTHRIAKGDVPEPLRLLQLSSISEPEELSAAFSEMGILLEDPATVASALAAVDPAPVEGSWHGVEVDGRYFAWDGLGLHDLSDRKEEPAPVQLLKLLGDSASFAIPTNLDSTLASGAALVYETDQRTWRRRLWGVGGEQVLVMRDGWRSVELKT